jgi:hypothetical protein
MKKTFAIVSLVLVILVSVFISHKNSILSNEDNVIIICDGINKIDLNNDGYRDIIIKSYHSKPSTTFEYYTYLFSIYEHENKMYKNILFDEKDIITEVLGNQEDPESDCNYSVVELKRINKKYVLITISLRSPDFENDETFISPKEAIKKQYKIEQDEFGIYRWKLVKEELIKGKNCNLKELI